MRRTALMFALAGMVGALVATPIAVYATHQFTDVSDAHELAPMGSGSVSSRGPNTPMR
jgi:hypothetical protein